MSETEQSWDELKNKEAKRRAVLKLDDYAGYALVLSHVRGTIVQLIVKDVLFWFAIILYVVMRLIMMNVEPTPYFLGGDAPSNNSVGLSVMSSILAIFLGAFVNTMTAQYAVNYGASRGNMGKITEIAMILSAIDKVPRERTRRIVELMNGAHLLSYVGLGGSPYGNAFFNKINSDYSLLSSADIERLNGLGMIGGGPAAAHEVLSWVVREINELLEEKWIPGPCGAQLRGYVFNFTENLTIVHADCTRFPFYYYHLITLTVMVYVPLFSSDMATAQDAPPAVNDIITITSVVLQALFAIGLRLIVAEFSDSYGDETYDLSVMTYVMSAAKGSLGLVDADFPEKEYVAQEQQLGVMS